MKTHLLRVAAAAHEFTEVIAAARALTLRVGWLELAAPAPLPESLVDAASAGALRAVAVGGGRSLALKPMRGAPVLEDVLREHFPGCALVLVQGDLDLPLLARAGDGWTVRRDDESRRYSTEQLARALRRPGAFDFDHPSGGSESGESGA